MKKIILTSLVLLTMFSSDLLAKDKKDKKDTDGSESYRALNLGLGVGYYGYVGHSMPVFHADFEFDVARNFTLAPFITAYTYRNDYYWGGPNYPYKNYWYRSTTVPVGVKGTYYFDEILGASPKWDFYLAGSLGFAFRNTVWESGYYGETTVVSHSTSGMYFDGHIGTEYHLNDRAGLFLDLSTGISTFGVAFHM
ncbi:MAG TPA: hypothetical protein VL651_13820 [Bacteroidia bacterium]|jgi:hypothetical protein|nr:hypothetical protein [Bacteroidia bacterium]